MVVILERVSATDMPAEQGELSSRAAAEAYVGGVCFKLGPPTLIGAELLGPHQQLDAGRDLAPQLVPAREGGHEARAVDAVVVSLT